MTREEAIESLSLLRIFDAPDLNEAVKMAVVALRAQADTPPNPPLTPEQLREMDGEPVYLDLGDGGEWGLVRVQQGKVFITHKNKICAPVNFLFECGGKAYRCKPEEGVT